MHATREATEQFVEDADLAAVGYATLGRTGLQVSRLGFGTFRLDDRAAPHKEALKAAIEQGVNLIDTAASFADGHAELAVAQVLHEVLGAGRIRREQLVITGKVGVVQGQLLREAREREAEEEPLVGMVHFQDGLWFSIHPTWIEEQIGRSLERLGLDALDLVFLHNPETFLADALQHRPGVPIEKVRDQLYGRIERAFEQLERECVRGRVGWYGVTSSTLVLPAANPQALDLDRLIDAAKKAAEKVGAPAHHFAAIELPLNLYENRAATVAEGKSGTLLARAKAAGLAVLVDRPLNAVLGPNRLIRLADPPEAPPAPPLAEVAEEVQAIEAIFEQDFAPKITVRGGPRPQEFFRWGKELADAPKKLTGIDHWRAMQAQVIGPQVQGLLSRLSQGFRKDVAFQAWARRYVDAVNKLLVAVSAELVGKLAAEAEALRKQMAPHVPDRWREASLARQALATLLSTDGVTSVLVGMRSTAWVEDALGAVALPPLDGAAVQQVYRAFARQG